MNEVPLRPLPPQLEVVALVDQEVERTGFAPASSYVETCWLPVLGPSATLLFRRLGTWASMEPDGLTVDTVDLALSFGLGKAVSRHSALARSVGRLVAFHAAEWQEEALAVRRALPPVSPRTLSRLTRSCREAHYQMIKKEDK